MTSKRMTKADRLAALRQIFTPTAPVRRADLFRGRIDQIMEITNAVPQPGAQIVLYGERGVGKTSLASLISEFMTFGDGDDARHFTVRVNCTTQDKFASIWRKAFRQLNIDVPSDEYWRPDPDEIRALLETVPGWRLIIFDEFDRVEDDEALSLMADTLKAVSDHDVLSKIMIVGVAMSITNLIGEHESVRRALVEVQMPRMSEDELSRILVENLGTVGMTIAPEAAGGIVRLAEGLPMYVHLLGQRASVRAAQDDRLVVEMQDVAQAIEFSVQSHALKSEYQQAIQSPRTDNLYSRVLVACALAEKNRLGQFTASAVRAPLSKITGRTYEIPAFARHLGAFTDTDRGAVLVREGKHHRYTYRFRDPLLQPFAVMAAMSDGTLADSYADAIFRPLEHNS